VCAVTGVTSVGRVPNWRGTGTLILAPVENANCNLQQISNNDMMIITKIEHRPYNTNGSPMSFFICVGMIINRNYEVSNNVYNNGVPIHHLVK